MSSGARAALLSVAGAVDWAGADAEAVAFTDDPSAIASSLPISDVAAGTYGALALAASELAQLRGAGRFSPKVNRRLAGLATAGNEYLTINAVAPATWDPLTGYYRCADGGYVYLHANFTHHRDGLLALFGAESNRASLTEKLSGWTADDAETRGQEEGLCCIKLRTREAWEAHPQRAALASRPVVRVQLQSGAATRPLGRIDAAPSGGVGPLSGLRVLDLSRIIAGPMGGRALAELGAEVIRISAPDLPSIEPLVVDTGFGKRAAFADLRTPEGRAALAALVRGADVLIDGFRPGALAAKGFGAEDLFALNPDLVVIALSAFSDIGPWAGRRGYDSYVQAGVGFAAPGPDGAPRRLACQPLDYLSACLAAFAALRGLTARAEGGGGVLADLSLARTAMWLWEMTDRLGPEPAPPPRNPTWEEAAAEGFLRAMDSDFGPIRSLAPAYGFEERDAVWASPPRPLGSDAPVWL